MHLHFSELNHNAGTLSHVMEDNSTCITTKLRQNLKVTTFFIFLQFAINDNDVSARKSNRKCHSIFFLAVVFVLGS